MTASRLDIVKYGIATGSSSACSLLAMVVVARSLQPEAFVAFNLVIVAGGVVGQLGAGFDSASARLLSRRELARHESITWTLSWRVIVLLSSTPLVVVICLSSPPNDEVPTWALVVVALLNAAAISFLSLSLIESQAAGNILEFGVRQFIYYGPLLVGIVPAAVLGDLSALLWSLAIVSLVAIFGILLSLRGVLSALRSLGDLGSQDYRQLALSIFVAGAAFAAADRIDLVLAAKFFDPDIAATFTVCLRMAMVMAIAVSAFQTMSIARFGALRDRNALDREYLRHWPVFLFLAAAVIAVSVVGSVFSDELFGERYSIGVGYMLLVCSPFLLYAIYSPYVLAVAGMGRRRDLLITSSGSVLVKIVAAGIASATNSVTLLFASGLLGAAAGCMITLALRSRELRRVTVAV